MCAAGQEGVEAYPYEDTAVNAGWTRTLDTNAPWDTEPLILRGLPMVVNEKPFFFKTDCWHNFHLGLAKHWLASSFVCAIERLDSFPRAAVDSRFEFLTEDFIQFCNRNRINPYMKEISRETMSFPSSKACPVGRWSKGAVATQLMQYLENYCSRFVINKTDDEVMLTVVFGYI